MSLLTLALVSFGCFAKNHARTETKQNLLLITIDTVRADHLGAYGYSRAETPNLDRLAREGVRFDQASSAVPLTLPSHATILSGLLPPHHGLRNNGAGSFPADRDTLATDLSASGYRTGAFVGSFVLDHRFGLARGFDMYDDEIPRDPASPSSLEAERPGSAVVDRALAWLEKDDGRPFFAWVHLYDAHAPYAPPEPFRSRHPDSPYDGEVASVDFQVGRLLNWIDRGPGSRQTIVAVAADHGEALGEHGEKTHGFFIYEATLRVPVIVRIPRGPRGGAINEPISLVDLGPTLAGLLGRPLAARSILDGRDISAALLGGIEPPATDVYAESRYPAQFGWAGLTALRRGGLKFIEAPRPELYDLRRDPREEKNRYADGGPRPDLLQRIASFQEKERTASSAPGAPETARKLASLGYLAAAAPPPAPASSLADPKDVLPLFLGFDTAHTEEMEGRLGEAGKRLLGLTQREPRNSVFADSAARVFRKLGDLPRSIDLYRRAVAANPEDLDARYDLSVALEEAGRPGEARKEIEEAIRRDPSHPGAHNALGVVLASEGKRAEALAEFEHAAALDSRDPQVQNNRGNVLRAIGRLPEAEQAYRTAIAASPGYADAWNGLGALEVQQGRPREAVACFERAIALAPQDHEARLNRGIALEMAGDLPSAASAYRDFRTAAKGDPRFARQRQVASELIARLAQKKLERSQSERR